MSNKSQVFSYFKDYAAKGEAHFNTKLVHLNCDNATVENIYQAKCKNFVNKTE